MSGFGWIRKDATLTLGLMHHSVFIWCAVYLSLSDTHAIRLSNLHTKYAPSKILHLADKQYPHTTHSTPAYLNTGEIERDAAKHAQLCSHRCESYAQHACIYCVSLHTDVFYQESQPCRTVVLCHVIALYKTATLVPTYIHR